MKKQQRQQQLLKLIQNERIDSQDKLVQRLSEFGFAVTQATVSRDIKDLHIVRVADAYGVLGYEVLNDEQPESRGDFELAKLVQSTVKLVQQIEFMTVIKTVPGHGNRVAAQIERSDVPEVVATLAGHDTIYVTSQSAAEAARFTAMLQIWLGAGQ